MKALTSAIFLSAIGFVLADDDVASAFTAAKLSPNIVKDPPTQLVEVTYGDKTVNLGNKLAILDTMVVPEIHYEYEPNTFYTLIMIDPDVFVLNSGNRQVLHWLVGNIPGDQVSEGTVLVEYLLPAPVLLVEPHRYTFLIYKQNQGTIAFKQGGLITGLLNRRFTFSLEDFIEQYNLGDPVFGNFFRGQLL